MAVIENPKQDGNAERYKTLMANRLIVLSRKYGGIRRVPPQLLGGYLFDDLRWPETQQPRGIQLSGVSVPEDRKELDKRICELEKEFPLPKIRRKETRSVFYAKGGFEERRVLIETL
jgi:hypothetical protein